MSPIRNVLVAGAGPEAWIVATGLLRAFRRQQLEVSVVDAGSTADARIGRWTLPSQRGVHALLGIAEPHLVQHTGATFRLATEHLGWQGEGSRFTLILPARLAIAEKAQDKTQGAPDSEPGWDEDAQ